MWCSWQPKRQCLRQMYIKRSSCEAFPIVGPNTNNYIPTLNQDPISKDKYFTHLNHISNLLHIYPMYTCLLMDLWYNCVPPCFLPFEKAIFIVQKGIYQGASTSLITIIQLFHYNVSGSSILCKQGSSKLSKFILSLQI